LAFFELSRTDVVLLGKSRESYSVERILNRKIDCQVFLKKNPKCELISSNSETQKKVSELQLRCGPVGFFRQIARILVVFPW
jgi:hypothetical protein